MSSHRRTKPIKRGALESCNAIRLAFGQEQLTKFPAGEPGDTECCPVRKSLEDIGIGEVFVLERRLIVGRAHGRQIASIWDTAVVSSTSTDRDYNADMVHVVLPPEIITFIRYFDRRKMIDLIEKPAELTAA